MRQFFISKVYEPLLQFLKQGTSPQKLALSLALGFVVGHFPVYGTTTTLCTLIALGFRLNLPALQLANYLALPTQIMLIVPFIDLGSVFYGPEFTLSLAQFTTAFEKDWWAGMQQFAYAVAQGMIGWAIVAPAVVLLLYAILMPLLQRISKKRLQQTDSSSVEPTDNA